MCVSPIFFFFVSDSSLRLRSQDVCDCVLESECFLLSLQLSNNAKPSWTPSNLGNSWASLARPFRYGGFGRFSDDFYFTGFFDCVFNFWCPFVTVQSRLVTMLLGLIWEQPIHVLQSWMEKYESMMTCPDSYFS